MKTVNIFGKQYSVKEFEDNARDDTEMGNCDTKKAIIAININMPDDVKNETMLHEVIHAIDRELLLGLTEQQVQGLGVGIFNFMVSNGIGINLM